MFILAGVSSAAFGLKGFLLLSRFIDGGVTGISKLLVTLTRLPLPALILVFNLPLIALGLSQLGRKFALRSALGIGGLALILAVVPFPDVTHDRPLTAVFGRVRWPRLYARATSYAANISCSPANPALSWPCC